MIFWKRLKGQRGFSIAEVMVASLILSLSLLPIMGMFDGALTGMKSVSRSYGVTSCAQAAMEGIKSLPYHVDYDPAIGDRDIDDFFWGVRSPENYNPYVYEEPGNPSSSKVPDWDNIPEVLAFDYGEMTNFPDYQVGVQLSYLNDSAGVAQIIATWGPKKPGNDIPKFPDNTAIHLLLIRVNVHWLVDGVTKTYSTESIKTQHEASYPAGIKSIEVLSPESVKGTAPNAIAHYPTYTATVKIVGYGFAADARAYIVRDPYADIEVNISSKTSEEIIGTVNMGMKAVGKWTVKVRQEMVVSLYLYQQFIVEYPVPIISDYNVKDVGGKKHKLGIFSLVINGGYFIQTPAVRLVQNVSENAQVIEGTYVAGTFPNGGYQNNGCSLEYEFNPVGKPTGFYKLQVVNKDPYQIGAGHVAAYASELFELIKTQPTPVDLMVDATGAHKAYRDRANPWKLRITGYDFNTVGSPPVEVFICTYVDDGEPAGWWVQATSLVSVSPTTIVAYFDLSSLPAWNYKPFVRNKDDNSIGYTINNPLTVKNFNGQFDAFVDVDASKDFWENYYDISSRIQGSDLANASSIKLTDGLTTYDITSDCSGVGGDAGDSVINVSLNLIDCSHTGSWRIQVWYPWGEYLERYFTVDLGPARMLTRAEGAITIHTWRVGTSPVEAWNTESSTAYAWSYETKTSTRKAYADFKVYGMGFPLGGNNTRLRVFRTTSPTLDYSGNYAVHTNRAAKQVWVDTADDGVNWQMPSVSSDSYCNIEVNALVGSHPEKDTQNNRWYVRNI